MMMPSLSFVIVLPVWGTIPGQCWASVTGVGLCAHACQWFSRASLSSFLLLEFIACLTPS